MSNQYTAVAWKKSLLVMLWVAVSFIFAQILIVGMLLGLESLGIYLADDDPGIITLIAAAIYSATLAIVVFVPYRFFGKARITKKVLGITRLPSWLDIILTPPAAVIYLLITAVLVTVATVLLPGFDPQQAQEVGFDNLAGNNDYLLAFITLIVLAPLAEELLFRGYLYGKLRAIAGLLPAVIFTSLLFGAAHMQWNLAVDTFALSLVLCSLREITGSIWAGVLLHMLKNGVAFYFIFINPSLLSTLGG